jgi:hypothetical protein
MAHRCFPPVSANSTLFWVFLGVPKLVFPFKTKRKATNGTIDSLE